MKKITLIATGILIAVIIIATVAGLYLTNNLGNTKPNSKLSVLATFYPVYYFAQNIGGDKVTVT